jgi:Nitrogen permease regulator 2
MFVLTMLLHRLLAPDNFPNINSMLSHYVIHDKELCNQLITVHLSGRKVIIYPVKIPDSKYDRGVFSFSVCMVFDEEAQTHQYEQVLSKFGRILEDLEVESGLVSSKDKMAHMLEHMYTELTKPGGKCRIRVGKYDDVDENCGDDDDDDDGGGGGGGTTNSLISCVSYFLYSLCLCLIWLICA